LRLLLGKVRSLSFGGLDLHFFSGFNFYECLGRGAVLPIGLTPNRATQHVGIVVNRDGFTGTDTGISLALANLAGVVKLIAAGAHADLEPSAALLEACQQCAVGAGYIGPRGVGDRIADEKMGGMG